MTESNHGNNERLPCLYKKHAQQPTVEQLLTPRESEDPAPQIRSKILLTQMLSCKRSSACYNVLAAGYTDIS